ncbi:HAD hydrolase-like protein [Virgibacillus byunsanensis]|uniref:HAD hydrolase-like protein n=1 Tax=Virgibacillus byunsanensis TaxID=570945 RepID=A0ABW3LFK3_9BACI
MNKTAYIDFDGTVVDVMPRYHGILESYLKRNTQLKLDYEKYCFLKKQGIKDHAIVHEICKGYKININDYVVFKGENLEDRYWLSKDIIIGFPEVAYEKLNRLGYNVKLLTQRNSERELLYQVNSLGIKDFFDEIVVLKPLQEKNAKVSFLTDKIYSEDIIIGDSKIEMEVADVFNIKGFFVESGLWGASFAGSKDRIFKDYNTVVNYLQS